MVRSNMNRGRWGVLLVIAAAVTFLAVSAVSAPNWNGVIGQEDGWQLVDNPATPMESEEVIRPEQQCGIECYDGRHFVPHRGTELRQIKVRRWTVGEPDRELLRD